jgi:hypothetical protein
METQGLNVANELVEGSVKEYGDTKEKTQKSIRKTLSCSLAQKRKKSKY